MAKTSKRFKLEEKKVDPDKRYDVTTAIQILKSMNSTKFDQTVELAIKLNIDPKKSDQGIRGSVALPQGIGKSRKVIVFADGDDAAAAEEAGADEVGMAELAKKIEGGWLDFDVALALPRTMRVISKLGKVLGPQGKMPSPKSGTVTDKIADAVQEFKAGKIEFRNDSAGNIHAGVGKLSFPESGLKENVDAFVEHITSLRPSVVKGHYVENVVLSASMSPSVAIEFQKA